MEIDMFELRLTPFRVSTFFGDFKMLFSRHGEANGINMLQEAAIISVGLGIMESCDFIHPIIVSISHTNQIHSRYGSIFLSMISSQMSDSYNSDFKFFFHLFYDLILSVLSDK